MSSDAAATWIAVAPGAPLALGKGTVQVADESLGMGEGGEGPEIGPPGGLEGGEAGLSWPRR